VTQPEKDEINELRDKEEEEEKEKRPQPDQ
jgi:hypothetical protein